MRARIGALLLALAVFITSGASAQETTGKIAGKIADSQGLAVPGATVTVDRAYLVRSITDPQADIPMGTTTVMQKKNLTDAQVQQIVDYIITLGANPSTAP